MNPITLETVIEVHAKKPKRRCFAVNTGIQKAKKDKSMTFSVKFQETIKPIYEKMTGFELAHSAKFDNYWHFIRSEQELEKVEHWEKDQGERVFLRDCLPLSIALAEYSTDVVEKKLTKIGKLEQAAKYEQQEAAIDALAILCSDTVLSLPFYKESPIICAVAARSDKEFDLPKEIAKRVAKNLDKKDASQYFVIKGKKRSLKDLPLEEKWAALDEADIVFNADPQNKNVILIDDLYQSGTTMQYMAMKLQDAGAKHVFGLSLVKGMRDTDNQ